MSWRLVDDLFLWFLIYSFAGWVYESILVSVQERRPVNRGFLNGPLCPIYGVGAVSGVVLLGGIDNPVTLFFVAAFGASVLEYVTSWAMEKLFHARWWDYSNFRININGRVCLVGAVVFGIGGVVIVRFVQPHVAALTAMLAPPALHWVTLALFTVFVVDLTVTVCGMVDFEKRLEQLVAAVAPVMAQYGDAVRNVGEAAKSMGERVGGLGEAARGVGATARGMTVRGMGETARSVGETARSVGESVGEAARNVGVTVRQGVDGAVDGVSTTVSATVGRTAARVGDLSARMGERVGESLHGGKEMLQGGKETSLEMMLRVRDLAVDALNRQQRRMIASFPKLRTDREGSTEMLRQLRDTFERLHRGGGKPEGGGDSDVDGLLGADGRAASEGTRAEE